MRRLPTFSKETKSLAELNATVASLNPKHRGQLSRLIHFLSASSDAQEKRQYLDRLWKEI